MNLNQVNSLFNLAGIEVLKVQEIMNQYSREHSLTDPWFNVATPHGDFVVGPRKRVYSINWEATNRRGLVTEDDVTKEPEYVHAYTLPKAVEYLIGWKSLPEMEDKTRRVVGEGGSYFSDYVNRYYTAPSERTQVVMNNLLAMAGTDEEVTLIRHTPVRGDMVMEVHFGDHIQVHITKGFDE